MKRTFSHYSVMILHAIITLTMSCSNDSSGKMDSNVANDTPTVITNEKKPISHFPFEIRENNGQYTIVAALESKELYPKYVKFFEKHGYTGNGYTWEGHIKQILEGLDSELLNHVDFDSEAGGFFAYTDTKENQLKFVKVLSPIFADLSKLENYIKKAKRSEIDD